MTPMKRPCQVLLVDDHTLVRRGLASLLRSDGRFEVAGEAGNGLEAISFTQQRPADIIILDLSMPRLNGLETIRRLQKSSRAAILVLSMHDDEQFVAQALRGGARGYLLKHAMDDELFQALETIVRGGRYVSSSIDMSRVQEHDMTQLDLTAREREVLQLIVDGHTTQQVADILSISPHTATRHRANLMQKLNAHNQVELVRNAAQKGLIIMPKNLSE